MVAQAKSRGFMDGGTPASFEGELLIENGLLVNKSTNAKFSDVEAALRRGDVAQISVDARYLWSGMPMAHPLGHAIVVTGLLVEKGTGKALGVYIDDTGTDPPGAGRFVPISVIKKAFTGAMAEVR